MKKSERKHGGQKLLALMLSIIMVVTMVPTAVFAEDEEEYVQEGVYTWPYDESEIYHTIYRYSDGRDVSENNYDYFESHCSVAMEQYNDNDHLWEGNRVRPTCTDMGYQDEECLFCHAHRITYEKPTGHQRYKTISYTEPTCDQPGITIYKCQWCDAKIKDTVPAIGHHWVLDETTSVDPTVWEPGHYD